MSNLRIIILGKNLFHKATSITWHFGADGEIGDSGTLHTAPHTYSKKNEIICLHNILMYANIPSEYTRDVPCVNTIAWNNTVEQIQVHLHAPRQGAQ